jgi:hypothetical protein
MAIAWLLAAGVSVWVGTSGDEPRESAPRLRPLDPLAASAIEAGRRRSPTFAALVQVVERSEFVVHVESSRRLDSGMQGCLVHGGGGAYYLRVLLKTGLSIDERIEVLAHELQHVHEVIEAGVVNDQRALQALFSRIGDRKRQRGARQQEYETDAARQISITVARELQARDEARPEPLDARGLAGSLANVTDGELSAAIERAVGGARRRGRAWTCPSGPASARDLSRRDGLPPAAARQLY